MAKYRVEVRDSWTGDDPLPEALRYFEEARWEYRVLLGRSFITGGSARTRAEAAKAGEDVVARLKNPPKQGWERA